MKNNFEHILLGLLWLMAATLGGCFWFNTYFGFNIFSVQHWQYLGYVQANHIAIKPMFYISLVVVGLILMGGIYFILRPRMRRIVLPVRAKHDFSTNDSTPPLMHNPYDGTVTNNTGPIAPTSELSPTKPNVPINTHTPTTLRPPRLNMPIISPTNTTTIHNTAPAPAQQSAASDTPDMSPDIESIFSDNGYIIKPRPRIGAIKTSLFAIGTDDVLWVGGYAIDAAKMQAAVDQLQGVFDDFLEDAEIDVRAFVVAPTARENADQVMIFNDMNDLREYITQNPNPPLDADERDNFDSYSDFITTVAEYIGKI